MATYINNSDAAIIAAAGATEFHLRPFESSRELWNRLVDSSPCATIYHTERWLDVLLRSYRLRLSLATIERGPEVLAACVLARSRRPFATRLVSLPFSDCCPPLARDEAALDELLKHLAADQGVRAAGCEIRGVAPGPPWHTVNCFAAWELDMTPPVTVIERGLHANFRRNLRRAAKLRVKLEQGSKLEHIERFYSMVLETRRHLGVPPQPFRMFNLARKTFSSDGSFQVWLASHEGRDAAGVVLLRHRDTLCYRWGARHLAAPPGINHLLFWSIVEESAAKFARCDLGRTDIRNEGLSRFKRELGARSLLLPYSYFPTAPHQVSAEVLSGPRKVLSQLWRRLPLPVTRVLGTVLYAYLG
jgi:Acetyltransferase (GNAT) domain